MEAAPRPASGALFDRTGRLALVTGRHGGLALTPAGATWPNGRDPEDSSRRLAPTFPSPRDVEAAGEGIAICIALAGLEARTARRPE